MDFQDHFQATPSFLTGAAIGERLKAEFGIRISGPGRHAELLYTRPVVLQTLYGQYMEVGKTFDLPMMIITPTRKINPETMAPLGLDAGKVIRDACAFLEGIREEQGDYGLKVFLGGHLGCKGDAYDHRDALPEQEAYTWHRAQVRHFARTGVDYLFAGIMPELNEAIGMARAMGESGLPYIISFMIRKDGRLIDGSPIADAIQTMDEALSPRPLCYMTNCIHPTNLRLALEHPLNAGRPELDRFLGLKANSSSLSPEELDNCGILHQEDFGRMVDEMLHLRKHHGLKILGGCCGTDQHFLNQLAESIQSTSRFLSPNDPQ